MSRKLPQALRRTLFSNAPLLLLLRSYWYWKGYTNWRKEVAWNNQYSPPGSNSSNPLETFFENRKGGRGIWKWRHYFDMYDRHFARFRGREVHVLEIGIYSGGSLEMWRDYFGPCSRIYGVDIQPNCTEYETESISISIGDQADPNFWKRFKEKTPALDIVIDDGGHLAEQQIVSFDELFPFLRPGGVYVCEDVHGTFAGFAMYVQGLAQGLNECERMAHNLSDRERRTTCMTTSLQSAVASVHLYPFAAVIERTDAPVAELIAPAHGTEWQPFLK